MKKFRSYIAVLLVMLVAVTLFVACDDLVHQHEYTVWESNPTSHWKLCTLDKVADTTTIGAHYDENKDGICDVCSYNMGLASDHAHDYSAWGSNSTSHWKFCVIDNIADTTTIGAHYDENKDGICDACSYNMGLASEHAHDYSAWGSNSTSHWKFCVLDNVADTTTIDVHHDDNKDGICDACSYNMGIASEHAHDYSAWGSNSTSHWKFCMLDNIADTTTIDVHHDNNKDGKCDACGYVMSTSGGNQGGDDSQGGNQGGNTGGDITGGDDYYNYDLSKVFEQYEDPDGWNFKIVYDIYADDMTTTYDTYTYGYKDAFTNYITYTYDYEEYTDYYDAINNKYYYDNGDGTYLLYDENEEDWEDLVAFAEACDISTLNSLTFTHFDSTSTSTSEPSLKHNQYVADNAVAAGNAILGEWETTTWTRVEIYLEGEDIYQIAVYASASYDIYGETIEYEEKYVLTFSDFGEIDFDLSDLTIDNGDDDNQGGGNQGGNTGGDTQTNATYTAVFTGTKLSSDCEIKFSATPTATGFDEQYKRGVQFYDPTGDVAIKTTTSLSNVTKVTLVVATNSKKGMNVSTSVGDTKLTSDGNISILVVKNGTNTATVEFIASSGVDGVVTITLDPAETGKSMWIKSVTIVCGGGSSSGGNGGSSSGIMPDQEYDADKHDNSTLRDQINQMYIDAGYEGEPCLLPLQSTGSYNCLVVPVQFGSYPISTEQLNRLNDAFNGTTTGWESVSSYYKKSSYNKLNLTFDISGIFTAKESASYYENYSKPISIEGESYTKTGDLLLLEEVMAWLEDQYDLNQYDNDGNKVLDAIWLIYSAPVSTDDDSIYWAYVTSYGQDDDEEINKYDGLELGYYLFAGLDFMDDYTGNDNDQKYYGFTAEERATYAIDGMITNACTYIHETGHLLGLDDYYDYNKNQGSNVGLGGADMMDNTVGDHCSYSKIMLGWVEPTIVTTTQTVTINPFESSGNVIMLLLDYNGTNFCEYLLIDLYTKTGLNETHGNQYSSDLYYSKTTETGAEYGIRVYHVSSNIDDPYSDDYYYSFTTNNNSTSDDALIKLVSANGGYITTETDYEGYAKDYAKSSDLFQTGDTLASYKRNDGTTVNFTITFTSVTADGATVSITF